MSQRGVFRVNYYEKNAPVSKLVCAETDLAAAEFCGVASQSGVSSVRVLFPVEVAGLDAAHDTVADIPVNVAPYEAPKAVSRDAFNALVAQVEALQSQLAAKKE